MMYFLEGGKGRGCLCTWKAHSVLDLEKECWPREICLASSLLSASYLWDCRIYWIYCLPPAFPPLVAVSHCTPWNFFKRLFLSSLWYCLAPSSCQWGRRPRAQRLRTGSWLAAKGTKPPCTLLLPLKPWLLFLVLRLSSTLSPTSPK